MVAIHRQRRTQRPPAFVAASEPGDGARTDGSRHAALALALRLNSFPGLANHIRQSPVPPGMLAVIRIASGSIETRADAVAATGLDERVIVSASVLLVSLFLGDSRGDPRRILCVRPDAPIDEVRDHMKWLLKWLHPDRNGQAPVSSMAVRVIEAWSKIKSSRPLPSEPATNGSASDKPSAKPQRKSRSKWRAIPLSVRRAELEATAGVEKLRRDVAAELSEFRGPDRSPRDDD